MRFLSLLAIALCLILRPVEADLLRGYGLRPSAAAESTSGHGCGKIVDKSTCERFSTTCYWDFVDPDYNRLDDEARCFDKEIEDNNNNSSASVSPSPRPEGDNVIIIGGDVVCERIVEKSTCENYSICVWKFVDPEYTRPGDEARCFDKPEIGTRRPSMSPTKPEIIPGEDIDRTRRPMMSPTLAPSANHDTDLCERLVRETDCENHSRCFWKYDDPLHTRPGEDGRCFDMCSESQSPSDCNLTKGCSWIEKGDASFCSVAPSQEACHRKKRSCEADGCLSFKTKKKRGKTKRECVGRWEHEVLSTLKGMTKTKARQAIEEQFGSDAYTVVFSKKGKQLPAKKKQWDRIRIYLNKKGKIKKTPRFG